MAHIWGSPELSPVSIKAAPSPHSDPRPLVRLPVPITWHVGAQRPVTRDIKHWTMSSVPGLWAKSFRGLVENVARQPCAGLAPEPMRGSRRPEKGGKMCGGGRKSNSEKERNLRQNKGPLLPPTSAHDACSPVHSGLKKRSQTGAKLVFREGWEKGALGLTPKTLMRPHAPSCHQTPYTVIDIDDCTDG